MDRQRVRDPGEDHNGHTTDEAARASRDRRHRRGRRGPWRCPASAASAGGRIDTTRAALNLIASGTLERYPDVKVILSHAGGFLPYLAGRAESQGRQGEFVHPAVFRRALRGFYYDTAMPASPYAMPTLLKAVGPSQILYGTDFAARPAREVGVITRDLDGDTALDGHTRRAVNRTNALRLFPRLGR